MPYIIQYMHDMHEGTMPMIARLKSVKRTAFNLAGNDVSTLSYYLFRRAFYCGTRLLDLDEKELFQCKECDPTGDGPKTV